MGWMTLWSAAGLMLATLGTAGWGQQVGDKNLLPFKTAGDLGAEMFVQAKAAGMVLVVVNRNGGTFFRGYGETAPGSEVVPGLDSVVRLCSLTKIFTADVLARMVAEDKVGLGDSLERWEPAWARAEMREAARVVVMPLASRVSRRGRATVRREVFAPEREMVGRITLEELATHTAGLPREIGEGPAESAHFTFPDMKERWAWLAAAPVTGKPGAGAVYSNVSFDFLSDALGQAAGRPYAEVLNGWVLKPLGMWETTFYPTADECGRLMRGVKNEGSCTITDATEGSSGLYSTSRDMARWLRYLLSQKDGEAAQEVVLTPTELGRAVGLDHAGEPTGMGLGWVHILPLESQDHIVEKTGGGAGFQTYIAINHARGMAVFLAVTKGGRGEPDEGKQRTEAKESGEHLNVFNAGNKLLLAVSGLPPLPDKTKVPVIAKDRVLVGKARLDRRVKHKRRLHGLHASHSHSSIA